MTSRRDFLRHTGVAAFASVAPPALVGGGAPDARVRRHSAGRTLTLVEDGRSRYGIAVRTGSGPAARHGARELQTHIRAMSGATLPILDEDDAAAGRLPTGVVPGHLISIGPPAPGTSLGEEAFTIRTSGPTLIIAGGGARGALYGCYALLEDALGVRWFTTDISGVPSRRTVRVPELDVRDAPAFSYRDPYWREAFQRDWSARNRCNGTDAALTPEVGGNVHYGMFVHTFDKLVPPATYFTTHPEYFSLVDGRRVPDRGLCLSNPAVAAAVVAALRHFIPMQPTAALWSVSQPDHAESYCRCGPCQAIAAEEGAQSGPLLRFVNAVADAIGRDYPHVLIDTLAYEWSQAPPRKTRPRPNVRVRFALAGACLAHAIDECPRNARVYQHLRAWAVLTDQLYVWHYGTNFHSYLQPLPNYAALGRDLALFRRLGVTGVFHEGVYVTGGGGSFAELKAYLLAKLMWNPARDVRALTTDFLAGVYGAGAPYVQQWIDAQVAEVSRTAGHDLRHATSSDSPAVPYLPDSLLTRGVALFDAAERATASAPVALDAVRKARLSLEYLRFVRSAPQSPERQRLGPVLRQQIDHYGMTQIGDSRPVSTLGAAI